jgi:hypothetical protein
MCCDAHRQSFESVPEKDYFGSYVLPYIGARVVQGGKAPPIYELSYRKRFDTDFLSMFRQAPFHPASVEYDSIDCLRCKRASGCLL